jgi:hypothetical protein
MRRPRKPPPTPGNVQGAIKGGQPDVQGYFISRVHIDEVKDDFLRTVTDLVMGECRRRGWTDFLRERIP